MRRASFSALLTSVICLSSLTAEENMTAYVTDIINKVVWTFPQSGPFPDNSPAQSITGFGGPVGITLSPDGSSVFVADVGNKTIYQIPASGPFPYNVSEHPSSAVVTNLDSPSGIAISPDGLTGYIADIGSSSILTFPTTGYIPHTATAAISNLQASTNGYYITLSPDGNTLLCSNDLYNTIYSFPAKGPFPIDATGQSPIITYNTSIFSTLAGMTYSLDGSKVFVAAYNNSAIYAFPADTTSLDLSTIDPIITGLLPGNPYAIAYSTDGKNLLIANGYTGTIYSIPADGPFPYAANTSNIIVTLQNSGFTYGIATLRSSFIATSSLKGNNLKVATYLNNNAPFATRYPMILLRGSALNTALESIAPTRNTLSTFATQLSQLSLSRLVSNHTGKNRWERLSYRNTTGAAAYEDDFDYFYDDDDDDYFSYDDEYDDDSLISYADEEFITLSNAEEEPPQNRKRKIQGWIAGFGEYSHVRPGPQTPNYAAGSGGIVAAIDYSGMKDHTLGAGAAYAHTHLHENNAAGHANINQGDLFVYGLFKTGKWYFDTALWGGYYHTHNVRKISFQGYDGGSATARIHGWQLSPHLEVGYDIWRGWVGIEPFAVADYVATWEHSAKESGSTLYNFSQKGRYCSLVRTETGLRVQQQIGFDFGTITFMEKGSYAYQKAFHTGTLNAFLVGAPGAFTVTTLQAAQNLGIAEFEILFKPKRDLFNTTVNLHTELGSRYQSYQGTIELSKAF